MKHILYGMGVLPSPHKKSLYNHLSFIDSVVWTVVRGGQAHGSPALHMLCFLTLNLRLSHTISKHHKTVKTEQWALLHPPPPTPSHFHPAFYTPSRFKFFLWVSSCPMQICPEGEIVGGGRRVWWKRTNKETNSHMFFMYLLQKNTFDVQATTKYVSSQPPVSLMLFNTSYQSQ